MTVLIFANGVIEDVDWIRPYLAQATAVLAANGGSRHLYRLGHPPDVVIGDIDSIPAEVQSWLKESDCEFIVSAAEKDETDLELALLYAVDHYAAAVLLFGTLGGRLDQMLGNIFLLTHPKLETRPVKLLTSHETAWIIRKESEINGRIGDLVSLIPLSNDVYVNYTTGLKYQLNNEPLFFGPARGISNELTKRKAAVSIQSGLLLCIHTRNN